MNDYDPCQNCDNGSRTEDHPEGRCPKCGNCPDCEAVICECTDEEEE